MGEVEVHIRVNGEIRPGAVEPRLTLADYLRERCGLTGTHLGCEHGVCGACTVLVDGEAVRSCLVFAVQADGLEVTTIEGLGRPRRRAVHGAVGVPGPPRPAVRVLHPRLRGQRHGLPPRQPRPRPTSRSSRRCPATSAAAPATRGSSRRSTPQPRRAEPELGCAVTGDVVARRAAGRPGGGVGVPRADPGAWPPPLRPRPERCRIRWRGHRPQQTRAPEPLPPRGPAGRLPGRSRSRRGASRGPRSAFVGPRERTWRPPLGERVGGSRRR